MGIIAEDTLLVPIVSQGTDILTAMPALISSRIRVASYAGLQPASKNASAAARGSSHKSNTRCEVLLRKALWRLGVRYRIAPRSLPGRPDIVIGKHRTAIFCDGDFWHGRNLKQRLAKLREGHNPDYWVEKIQQNVARDRRRDQELVVLGWRVIRIWESDILTTPEDSARSVWEQLIRRDVVPR